MDADCSCFDGPYRQYHVGVGWICASCGAEVVSPDTARDTHEVELLRQALGPLLSGALERAQPKVRVRVRHERAAYSMRQAAARLGIGRDKLRALCTAGLIRITPWGGHPRIGSGELERVCLEGLPALPEEKRRARRQGRRRPRARGDADALRRLDVESL